MASHKGRPKADTEPVMVRLPSPLLAAIDEFRRKQKDIPTRPEAIRLLLKDRLVTFGYLKAEK
jgi:metal-responsive CopG/Arc/MetJ family transcriptional regulator